MCLTSHVQSISLSIAEIRLMIKDAKSLGGSKSLKPIEKCTAYNRIEGRLETETSGMLK